MARAINIEIMRIKSERRTALLCGLVALAIACLICAVPGSQANYVQADQNRHTFVLDTGKDVTINLTEDQWAIENGKDIIPGAVRAKNPVVLNEEGESYMRVNMRICDNAGNTLDASSTDEAVQKRIELILNTIGADPDNTLSDKQSYSLSELKSKSTIENICNSKDFDAPYWNDEMKAWTINCNRKLAKGDTAKLFDKIAVPSDYSNDEMAIMTGEGTSSDSRYEECYYINIWAQAIQADGFDDRDSALAVLSNKNVENKIELIEK